MTTIYSSQVSHKLSNAQWVWNRKTGKVFVYNVWFFKTLELDSIDVVLPLN